MSKGLSFPPNAQILRTTHVNNSSYQFTRVMKMISTLESLSGNELMKSTKYLQMIGAVFSDETII